MRLPLGLNNAGSLFQKMLYNHMLLLLKFLHDMMDVMHGMFITTLEFFRVVAPAEYQTIHGFSLTCADDE